LQVKRDILEGRLMCPQNTAVILASYAVQCKYLKTFVQGSHYFQIRGRSDSLSGSSQGEVGRLLGEIY